MIRHNIQILLVLLIVMLTFFVNNDVLEANIMESRNLTTAREMLEKGNWFEPTMNGEIRLEKPPLPTWITAISMLIFGQDNLALLRLPSALATLLMIFFLFMLTKELTNVEGLPFLVAGTAATSFYIFFMARDISWDIFSCSFMIGAIWLIHRALRKDGQRWTEFIIAGVLMGLAFLSKGPVSFYTLLLPYLISRTITLGWKNSLNKRTQLIIMGIITLMIGFWWPVSIYLSNPDYSAFVAQKESAAWLNRNTRPFYHYWSFPVQSGIWTILATISLVFPYAKKRIDRISNYWFLAGWVLIAVLLLSLFPEKKERYLLPVLLPLSILTACYISYLIEAFEKSYHTKSDTILLRFNGILMAIISIALPVTAFFMLKGKGGPGILYLIILLLVFLLMAFVFIKASVKKKPYWIWIGMAGLVALSCTMLLPVSMKIMQSNPEYRSYKELRYREDLKNIPFYFNGEIPGKFIEVVWNCGHEVKGWNPLIDQNLPSEPPVIFISHEQPIILLRPDILAKYEVEVIGHFDGNMEMKRRNAVLSNYVTIIRPHSK